jgi:hypothetical protein
MNSHLRVLFLALVSISAPALAAECFDEMPGEPGIRSDTPDRPKITELVISDRGEKAFVATEYLGTANLQASIYLLRDKKYCPAGDLGAAVAFKSDRKAKNENYFGVVVESKSGSDRFYRMFKYEGGSYVLNGCRVQPHGGRPRKCKESER